MKYECLDYIEFECLDELFTQQPIFKPLFIAFYLKHNPEELSPKECQARVNRLFKEKEVEQLLLDLSVNTFGCDSEVYEDFFFENMSVEGGFYMFDYRSNNSSSEVTYELRLVTAELETKAEAITLLRKAIANLGIELDDVFAASL